jgi:DNA replication protein DnaC
MPKTLAFDWVRTPEEESAFEARQAEAEADQADRALRDAEESRRKRIDRARFPARHADRELAGGAEWGAALEGLRQRLGTGFLVALLGIRGAGKTQLAVEAARARIEAGGTGRYVKTMDLLIRFREAFRKDGPSEKTVLEEFLSPDILVIDALEERAETQFEDRMISHLIDLRYDAMLDTILISNQTKDAFKLSVGNSVVSRLIETGEVIECTWESFRRKQA